MRLVVGAGLLGALMALQFALYRILERFEGDPLRDARIPFARNTLEAAAAHLPFGSGLGSFVTVYGLFERPSDALLDTFANRAHNDFLEGWLELGLVGALLFAAFLAWFTSASITAWRQRVADGGFDSLTARAASLAIVLLLLHSLVDYPLRTAALLTMFAFCCALLVPSPLPAPTERARATTASRVAETPRREPKMTMPAPKPSVPLEWPTAATEKPFAPRASKPDARWGDGIEWPEEWRRNGPASATEPRRNPGEESN